MSFNKKKSSVRKIYKTTDGYFTQNSKINKPRRVVVVDQRKDDGALAVTKIYSKDGKDGKRCIPGLVLKPEKHSSLTKDSIVGKDVIIGTKSKGSQAYASIYERDFEQTDDMVTKKEHRAILRGVGGKASRNKNTLKRKMKGWRKHFRK